MTIENESAAEKVSLASIEVSKILNELLIDIESQCSEGEFRELRLVVGRLLGDILLEILNPLYRQHPRLMPKELRDPPEDD
jgi:hypothetical protein